MKKAYLVMLLILTSTILMSCGIGIKRDIQAFFDTLEINDIMNQFETDEGDYSVFLSSEMPFVFLTFSKNNHHLIIVRNERSFAYLSGEEFDEARDFKYEFSFNKSTHRLNQHQYDEIEHIQTLESNMLISVVYAIKDYLMISGDLLTFDTLFPIIKESFSNVSLTDLSLFGDKNHSISRKFRPDEFFLAVPSFLFHLDAIYNPLIKQQIIESMTTNNHRNAIIVTVQWDSTRKMIRPRLVIEIMNAQFYVVDPFIEYFDFLSV